MKIFYSIAVCLYLSSCTHFDKSRCEYFGHVVESKKDHNGIYKYLIALEEKDDKYIILTHNHPNNNPYRINQPLCVTWDAKS